MNRLVLVPGRRPAAPAGRAHLERFARLRLPARLAVDRLELTRLLLARLLLALLLARLLLRLLLPRLLLRFGGTFSPFSRASDNPMAMA